MKLYLNLHYVTNNDIDNTILSGANDIFLLIPYFNKDGYFKLSEKLGETNHSNYNKLYYSKDIFYQQSKNIEECDYSVLPFKYSPHDNRVSSICEEAKKHNKKVLAFFTDDNSSTFSIPENLILFRTSLNKSQKQNNERVMPYLKVDNFYGFTDYHDNSISFCGQDHCDRQRILEKIKKTNIKTNFIIRKEFFANEICCRVRVRKEFYKNLSESRYAFCMRGSGNFSIRFYEALCFGRIPIFINTDNELPFSKTIDWSKHIIEISENDIDRLPDIIKNDNRSMIDNRKLWEEYFSPHGYAKNLNQDID